MQFKKFHIWLRSWKTQPPKRKTMFNLLPWNVCVYLFDTLAFVRYVFHCLYAPLFSSPQFARALHVVRTSRTLPLWINLSRFRASLFYFDKGTVEIQYPVCNNAAVLHCFVLTTEYWFWFPLSCACMQPRLTAPFPTWIFITASNIFTLLQLQFSSFSQNCLQTFVKRHTVCIATKTDKILCCIG